MWARKSLLKFSLLLLVKCELSTCSPLDYSDGLRYKIVPTASIHPLNVFIPGNRDEITDISEIFTTDYWFPIEINVPDTFISAWEGAQSAWAFASDYFSMGNGEMPSPQAIN